MRQKMLFTWTAAILISVIASQPAQGQDTASQKTVQEKITTIRETVTTTREASTIESQHKTRLVAIFVKNRAGRDFADKLGVFEDLVTAEITNMGFQVMSPEDTLKAVRSFLGTELDQSVPGAELDELLDNNTSALRLAQNMGVNYLFVVSIATFGTDTQRLQRPDLGIDRKKTTHKLRAVYKILDAGRGESISAGTITSSVPTQAAEGFSESTDAINDLLADASVKIAGALDAKGGTAGVADSRKADSVVEFIVQCSVQDLSVPEAVKDDNGNYILMANRYKLQALNVTVELDGVVIGTAPGKFNALPGLHKIRLTRESYDDWERTVKIYDGLPLSVALTLSPEGRKDWLEMADFFSKLKRNERLAEADAELIKGYAQMMRQSGVRIIRTSDVKSDVKSDAKSNVKIDTKNAPSVNQTNVDQQNVAQSVWP